MSWEAHADKAAALEAEGEQRQWEAKCEYEAAAAEGASERMIADRVGKSQPHIHYLITMVIRSEADLEGISFAEAYARAKKPHANDTARLEPAAPPPLGTYRTIVADPPWKYDNRGTRGAAEDHYRTMSVEDICAIEVPAADEAHLYLWVTNAFLRDGFDVVAAWGFDYKTCLTWVKPQIGLGNYFRNATEHVLFGTRGDLGTTANDVPTWFNAKRGQHSAKPDCFFDLVEKSSPGPYLEMFARVRRLGWAGWGDEA